MHYSRWLTHGDPTTTAMPTRGLSAYERWSRLVAELGGDGCWVWTGAVNGGSGYGHFGNAGVTLSAHRFSYEHHVGPIPDGLQIDHLCRNRLCVNPAHLEPVTAAENLARARLAVGK